MRRRPRHPASKSGTATVEKHVAPDLRRRLEAARLDLLTLFRTHDSLHLAEDLPDELHDLFELDADDRQRIAQRLPVVGATIDPREAYSLIPGRDPRSR